MCCSVLHVGVVIHVSLVVYNDTFVGVCLVHICLVVHLTPFAPWPLSSHSLTPSHLCNIGYPIRREMGRRRRGSQTTLFSGSLFRFSGFVRVFTVLYHFGYFHVRLILADVHDCLEVNFLLSLFFPTLSCLKVLTQSVRRGR